MSGKFISDIYTYGVDEKGNQIKSFVINNGVRTDIKLPD